MLDFDVRSTLSWRSPKEKHEGVLSNRLGTPYRSGRSRHWVKSKNPKHSAVKREAEEDWKGR
jgi:ATP-dependent DNA ligase